jgi:ABC-2 type transport system ATP-binding protein
VPGVIDIQGLSFRYPKSHQKALTGIELKISEGRLFGLLGPNGAGKTTLLSVLTGLLPCKPATVLVGGVDISRNSNQLSRSVALVPQDFAFYSTLTITENLLFFAKIQNLSAAKLTERIDKVIAISGLQEFKKSPAGKLSGGLKRRLNIAIGLLNEPTLLFLDEPTVGIDPHSRHFILEAIKKINEKGTTIVYTSHYMEEIENLCDEIAIMDEGRILLQGPLNDLLRENHDQILMVRLAQNLMPKQREDLRQLIRFEEQGTALTIAVDNRDEIYEIMRKLHQASISIEKLSYGTQNLEQLFLDLTSHSLRD